MIDITKSIKACAAFYGKDADAMELYLKEGEKKALDLNNRGPIKFDDNGNLCKEIRKSYSEYGFYIFENVIDPNELNDTKEDLENGGPVYGVLGYTIISIEYEVPLDSIGSRPVGDPEQQGISFLAETLAQEHEIPFDHFHIGVSHSHKNALHEHEDIHMEVHKHENTEEVYLIHFMLIPHETEVAYGLTCS